MKNMNVFEQLQFDLIGYVMIVFVAYRKVK